MMLYFCESSANLSANVSRLIEVEDIRMLQPNFYNKDKLKTEFELLIRKPHFDKSMSTTSILKVYLFQSTIACSKAG